MNITLYHYAHCPFCVRVRMTFGALGLPYKSVVLPYNDEITPTSLTGTKMLPIADVDGAIQNESLEIMALVDKDHKFEISKHLETVEYQDLTILLSKLGANIHSLAMPNWIWTPEFNEESRKYFQNKKEEKRGPFLDLVKNRLIFEVPLNRDLNELEKKLTPFYSSSKFGFFDILLAAHLWGLYIVPEFQFSPKIHSYLQEVKRRTNFNYLGDFWS